MDSDASLGYQIPSGQLDEPSSKPIYWQNDFWTEGLGIRQNIAIYKESMKAITRWAFGRGVTIKNQRDEATLDRITGRGDEDFISIIQNLDNTSYDNGDAYAEIVKTEDGELINLKPLSPSIVRYETTPGGIIDHYEVLQADNNWETFPPGKILHICVDRIANQIHGTPKWKACKFELEAKKEAMECWRKALFRSTIRVIYVDFDDDIKLDKVRTQWKKGIKDKEVLLLPGKKGDDMEVVDYDVPPIDPFIRWIEYLDREIYKSLGVPKVIVDTADFSEASSKVGYMTFEPVYTERQIKMESDLWNQLAIRVKFNRPPSLHGVMAEDEQKNTGQVGIQPNETEVTPQRTE